MSCSFVISNLVCWEVLLSDLKCVHTNSLWFLSPISVFILKSRRINPATDLRNFNSNDSLSCAIDSLSKRVRICNLTQTLSSLYSTLVVCFFNFKVLHTWSQTYRSYTISYIIFYNWIFCSVNNWNILIRLWLTLRIYYDYFLHVTVVPVSWDDIFK